MASVRTKGEPMVVFLQLNSPQRDIPSEAKNPVGCMHALAPLDSSLPLRMTNED